MVHLTALTLLPLLLLSTQVTADLPHTRGRSLRRGGHNNHHHEKIRSVHAAAGGMKKRGDGKVCRIKTQGGNSTSTSTSGVSSASVSGSVRATAVASRSASSIAASSTAVVIPISSTPSSAAASSTSTPAPAATSSSAAPTTTSSAPAQTSTTSSTSNNSGTFSKKAGIAGGDSMPWVKDHIGMWSDWGADGDAKGSEGAPVKLSMIWGSGSADSTDASRLSTFSSLSYTPAYIIGYEEPDCAAGGGSAGFGVAEGVSLWEQFVVPRQKKGSVVLSPSMCHQAAETGWLGPFKDQISQMWDITNVHINKNSMEGVKADLDHYASYGKPIAVTEFACVDDSTDFIPCTDQNEINSFISQIVDLFEKDDRVVLYMYSDGMGLGNVWPTVSNGQLSASGQAYLSAISKYS